MSAKPGKNAGISGVIDLPTAPAGQQLIQVLIRKWALRLDGTARQRRGRGGGRFATPRWIMAGGSVLLTGKIRSDGPPTPEEWNGITGTLTIKYTADKSVDYPVLISAFDHSFTLISLDTWEITVTAQVTGAPTYSDGWGPAPIPSTVTKTDQIQWEGSQKIHDPNGLLSGAQVLVDIWDDLADTDAAEVTKITTVLAAATEPMTGLKVKTASFSRDAMDGGTIAISYALTDSAEDVINPQTSTSVDPNELQTHGTVAAINATPSLPTISGQTVVERSTRTLELNDAKTLSITEFANRSTADDIQNPGTFTITDPSDLESRGLQTSIYAYGGSVTAAGIPLGLQVTSTKIEAINQDRKQVTYEFAKNTSKQAIEFPGTFTNIDPSDLENTGRQTSVYAASGSPTAAADLSASKLYQVGTTIRFLNPDQKQVIYDYARQTNAQKVVNNAGYVFTDPSGLESKEIAAAINDSTPTALSALTADRGTRAQYLNPDNILYTQELGVRTTEQDITYLKSIAKRSSSLGAEDHRFVVEITTSATTGSPANPDATNLSFRGTETYRITDSKYVHAHEFAPFTAEEDIEAQGTESTHEESTVVQPLIAEDKETVFDTNATAPTAPAHSGLVPVRVSTRKRSKTGYAHTFYYDYRTNADKLSAEKTVITIDSSAIEHEITTAAVVTAGAVIGSPTAPTVVTGTMVLVAYTDLATSNPAYSLRVYRWGLITNAQKIEFGGTVYGATAASIAEDEVTSIVDSTVGGASQRDTLYNTYQQDATFKALELQQIVPNKWRKKIITSGADKVILPGGVHTFEDSVTAVPYDMFSTGPDPTSQQARVLVGKLSAVVVGGPGGATSGRIDPIVFWRTRGRFALERRYAVALAGIDALFYHSLAGTVDDAAFAGHPAYTVMYEGATLEYCIPNPTTDKMVAVFRYHFQTDSAKHFSARNIPSGWTDCRSGVTLGSVGYFDPRTFADYTIANDYYITWPGISDFTTTFL